jgi:hypothetical protein
MLFFATRETGGRNAAFKRQLTGKGLRSGDLFPAAQTKPSRQEKAWPREGTKGAKMGVLLRVFCAFSRLFVFRFSLRVRQFVSISGYG